MSWLPARRVEYRSTGVQEYRSTGVQEFRSTGVQGGKAPPGVSIFCVWAVFCSVTLPPVTPVLPPLPDPILLPAQKAAGRPSQER
jgi:hypothetical protein